MHNKAECEHCFPAALPQNKTGGSQVTSCHRHEVRGQLSPAPIYREGRAEGIRLRFRLVESFQCPTNWGLGIWIPRVGWKTRKNVGKNLPRDPGNLCWPCHLPQRTNLRNDVLMLWYVVKMYVMSINMHISSKYIAYILVQYMNICIVQEFSKCHIYSVWCVWVFFSTQELPWRLSVAVARAVMFLYCLELRTDLCRVGQKEIVFFGANDPWEWTCWNLKNHLYINGKGKSSEPSLHFWGSKCWFFQG